MRPGSRDMKIETNKIKCALDSVNYSKSLIKAAGLMTVSQVLPFCKVQLKTQIFFLLFLLNKAHLHCVRESSSQGIRKTLRATLVSWMRPR